MWKFLLNGEPFPLKNKKNQKRNFFTNNSKKKKQSDSCFWEKSSTHRKKMKRRRMMSAMTHLLKKNSTTENTLKGKEKEPSFLLPESTKLSEKPSKTTSSSSKMKSSESSLSSVKSGPTLKSPSLWLLCQSLQALTTVCRIATFLVQRKDSHLSLKEKDLDQRLTLLSKRSILGTSLSISPSSKQSKFKTEAKSHATLLLKNLKERLLKCSNSLLKKGLLKSEKIVPLKSGLKAQSLESLNKNSDGNFMGLKEILKWHFWGMWLLQPLNLLIQTILWK